MFKTFLRSTLLMLATTTTLAIAPLAHAQGVPVVDPKNILESLKQYEQMLKDYGIQTDQLESLVAQVEQIEQQIAQYDEMISLLSDPTDVLALVMGGGMDGLLEGNFEGSMVDAISKGATGDWSGLLDGSGQMRAITSALASAGTTQEKITALANSGNANAARNATATAANAATSAAAEAANTQAQQLVTRSKVLIAEIPQLKSVKESMDHNTRVTAELAIAMAALLQVESAQVMNDGMGGVVDAATIAAQQKYLTQTLPEFK